MAQKYTAEVIQKDQLTKSVYFVTFKLLEPSTITFRAGQCMMLMCVPGVNRTMSICSVPQETNQVSMIADVSPMGPGSKWTLGLSIGDKVSFVSPTGVFFFDEHSPRKKVFVATGTGVAPFRSMIEDYLEQRIGELGEVSGVGDIQENPSLVLYWGQRYEKDIYWKQDFDRLSVSHPTFSWHQVLSKPGPTWQGLTGHVTEQVLEKEKDLQNSDFYLCGSKAMIEEVRNNLLEQNVPKEQLKTELFY